MSDNLRKWREYLSDLESPDVFIDYTFLWTISAALQRRVYYGSTRAPIHANVFYIFVAEPGIGKSLSARIAGSHVLKTFFVSDPKQLDKTGLPVQIPAISFSADCTSYESLIQQLSNSMRTYDARKTMPNGNTILVPQSHNSLCLLLSEELTTLFRTKMDDISGALNAWYDSTDFKYQTISRGEDSIKNVCVCMLGCTTPENVSKLMKLGVLDQGLNSRGLFIYAKEQRQRKHRFDFTDEQVKIFEPVRAHIKKLLDVEGEVDFTDEADAWYKEYYESGRLQGEILNKDPRVKHYGSRIKVHAIKQAMLFHFADNTTVGKVISLQSLQAAIASLRSVELDMHKALASKSKNELYDEAMDIIAYMRDNKGAVSKLQLRLKFGSQLAIKQLDECIEYLKLAGYAKEEVVGNKLMIVLAGK